MSKAGRVAGRLVCGSRWKASVPSGVAGCGPCLFVRCAAAAAVVVGEGGVRHEVASDRQPKKHHETFYETSV